MKSIISWFAENHVASNLLMMFLIIAGILTIYTIKIEVFPQVSTDRISITAIYPGASPAEVEEGVIRRIEENIAGLSGVKRIDSTARESFASVVVEVIRGWDINELVDDIKSNVDRITTFPDEMEEAVVREIEITSEVIHLAVYGDAPEKTLKHLSEKLKDEITNLEGVTVADLFGVRNGEIHIEISESTLRRYGLTLGQVANAIRRSSFDLPAGSVKTKSGEVLIRAKGRRYYASDYKDIAVITKPDGSKVTLDRIANLRDGFQDSDLISRFQGKPAAIIRVFRVSDQNALDVVKKTKKYVEEIKGSLPEGIKIGYLNDRSVILKSRINLLMKNMLLGLVLVSILLAVLLNMRLAFWVTLGIPISFLMGLWLIPTMDVSINMLSLFAFILILGIVVDDAIIIGENIFRKQEEGLPPLKAAKQGATEMGRPVIFAVFTTIAAFSPLLTGSGMMAKVMKCVPVVVIFVLLGSLVESLMILPAHLAGGSHAKPIGAGKKEKRTSIWLKKFISGPYFRFLNLCIKWRYITLSISFFVLFLCVGTMNGGWIKFNFMPKVESDEMICMITMPAGTPFDRTAEIALKLENAGREILKEADAKRPKDSPSLFEHCRALVGVHMAGHGPQGGSVNLSGNLAQINIQLLEGEKRDVSAAKLVSMWRKRAGAISEAESITFQSELFSVGNPIEVHLSSDNQDMLIAAADDLKAELGTIPGVFDINDSFMPGKMEMQLKLKPAARSLGLTLNDLAFQTRHAFYGAEALRIQRDQDEVKVMVRYPVEERKTVGNINNMRIRTPDGIQIPFSQVAEAKMIRGYSVIERAQRRRVIKVIADIDPTIANADIIRKSLENEYFDKMKQNYPGLRCKIEGEGKEQRETFGDLSTGFILALFMIYTLLAIPFKSFTQPFVVMIAIPFGIVGALWGHFFMGYNMSILSIFGIVGLAGVVVNDSLVLIDAANQMHIKGKKPREAIVQAGMNRFRAIVLTSLTTFAGLGPMMLEKSVQAQFLIPMAISLGFGVLFATVITLIMVPCTYMIREDMLKIPGALKSLVFTGKTSEIE
ncbi:MAG: efflux RND transporter permease subunit [Desulfobacteraceae bacterium]|nr:efflux RND transporter permease subunit [Desulfobacteraceae bacterium]